ncbi:MAG: PQQ-binding-like beta-propeller repeat protein [Lachnospiraceae bacterium]|nr:PQQ-binding-like beta-propeller repeat protein [Lachnospiraceae bacterium]
MRKIFTSVIALVALAACAKHDPILPGTRSAIFASNDITVLNTPVPDVPENFIDSDTAACPYRQDSSNVIWHGERKIFSGFATPNSVASHQRPVCHGKYVYAGLTTGELVKVNPTTRVIAWMADIYRPSNLTGGASVVDITAPIVVDDAYVYAGGLGDAYCKINNANGAKKWCVNIGVGLPFLVANNVSYVVSTDGKLYAIRDSDGAVYWRTSVDKQVAPKYSDGVITVGREKFDAKSGNAL